MLGTKLDVRPFMEKVCQELMRLDTGAPFSVVPYTLWHDGALPWQPLGTEFWTQAGLQDRGALLWQGIPCQFGELQIRLVDEVNQRSRPLRTMLNFSLAAFVASVFGQELFN